jgi:thioredoxin 1
MEGATMSNVSQVTDNTFESDVLQSKIPVMVDFWAPWCGPCQSVAKILDELAREYAGQARFVKINVDENPLAPTRYGVRGIPNLILFQNGKVEDQVVGAVPKSRLARAIERVIGQK